MILFLFKGILAELLSGMYLFLSVTWEFPDELFNRELYKKNKVLEPHLKWCIVNHVKSLV